MGGSAASPINYNLFISVPLMVVSFRDGLWNRAVCELISFKKQDTERNAFHTLNCHVFGRHSVIYYCNGLYSQNIKVCLVQGNASLSFAGIKSLKPDMAYLGVIMI